MTAAVVQQVLQRLIQKGNAPTERKIQRLFRREEVAHIIKKCNDFGAGGVSVAIGELADGLRINLDKVPKKYAGLDGTELAISESQERMAVVVAPEDVKTFLGYAAEENLEAVEVAVVTEDPRLVLEWRGKEIVNLSRAFLDTNGAHQETNVEVEMPEEKENYFKKIAAPKVAEAVAANDMKAAWMTELADLNVCSQKGLVEMFDGSIGVNSVYMPFGGKYQLTETQSMVAKLPVAKGDCDTFYVFTACITYNSTHIKFPLLFYLKFKSYSNLIVPLYRICFAVTCIFAGISRTGRYERASAEFSITLFLVNLCMVVLTGTWR